MSTPLRFLREANGFTLRSASSVSGVGEATISDWERGRTIPKPGPLDTLLDGLGATANERRGIRDFFYGEPPQEKHLPAVRVREKPYEQVIRPRRLVNAVRFADQVTSSPLQPASQSGTPDPLPIATPVEFAQALNAVHVWAGAPSLRKLQDYSGGVLRRATISDMLNTKKVEETQRIPDLDRCIAFVRLCGIREVDDWVSAWRRLKARQRPQAGGWLKA